MKGLTTIIDFMVMYCMNTQLSIILFQIRKVSGHQWVSVMSGHNGFKNCGKRPDPKMTWWRSDKLRLKLNCASVNYGSYHFIWSQSYSFIFKIIFSSLFFTQVLVDSESCNFSLLMVKNPPQLLLYSFSYWKCFNQLYWLNRIPPLISRDIKISYFI